MTDLNLEYPQIIYLILFVISITLTTFSSPRVTTIELPTFTFIMAVAFSIPFQALYYGGGFYDTIGFTQYALNLWYYGSIVFYCHVGLITSGTVFHMISHVLVISLLYFGGFFHTQ